MGRKPKLRDIAQQTREADEADALFPEEGVLDVEVYRPTGQAVDMWTRVFLEAELDLHAPEAKAARMRVAWRGVRALAIFQGRIDAAQSLDSINLEQANTPKALTAFARDNLPKNVSVRILGELPLMPPEKDQEAWLEAMSAILYMMNCSVLQEKDPQLGSQNFWGLLHPSYYQALFPSISHLATYERKALHRCLKYLVRHGPIRAYEWLRSKHTLTAQEAKMMLSMARTEARSIIEFDQEEERAVMTLRLLDHQERSRRGGNLREELQSMKQEAIVRGLTATQPEGFGDIFGRVVDVIAKKAPKQDALPQTAGIQADDKGEEDDDD